MSSWGQGDSWAAQKARRDLLRDNPDCQLRYPGCTGTATQAHHIHGLHGRRRHEAVNPDELIPVCPQCHQKVTEQQRRAAFDAKQKYRNQRRHLPQRPHPGD